MESLHGLICEKQSKEKPRWPPTGYVSEPMAPTAKADRKAWTQPDNLVATAMEGARVLTQLSNEGQSSTHIASNEVTAPLNLYFY